MNNLNAAEYYRTVKDRYRLLNVKGTLKSITTIYQTSKDFEDTLPYSIGMVELENNEIIYAQVIGAVPDDAVIGCLRKMKSDNDTGLIWYGVKFRKL